MIIIKDSSEIKKMQEGGKILAEVLGETLKKIEPGVTEEEVDMFAEELIVKKGGYPAFKKVKGYSNTLCLSVNDVVVHGVPGKRAFREGDVVGVDCGVFYKGLYTDMAETKLIGEIDEKVGRFLETGKEALNKAVSVVKSGRRIGDISTQIEQTVFEAGYSVVRTLVGHGVGKELHEDPEIPGFLDRSIEKTPLLKEGMTIAIEVIYNMGAKELKYDNDGWTIRTKDGSLSGLFERTVLVRRNDCLILTK